LPPTGRNMKKNVTYIWRSSKNCRIDMNVGWVANDRGDLGFGNGPRRIQLIDCPVQFDESYRWENIIPSSSELKKGCPCFLLRVFEDVCEGGDDVAREQLLVWVGMVFNDRIHQVQNGQLQFCWDLKKEGKKKRKSTSDLRQNNLHYNTYYYLLNNCLRFRGRPWMRPSPGGLSNDIIIDSTVLRVEFIDYEWRHL